LLQLLARRPDAITRAPRGLLRRLKATACPQQLLKDVARRQGSRRDESRDHTHHDRAHFADRDFRVDESFEDSLVKTLRRFRPADRKLDQGGVDHGAHARRPGQTQVAGRGVAEWIGEKQRRYRHRPFGESVSIVDIQSKVFGAGFGRNPRDEILHDIDAPS
jgi:hypothetical protein